MTATPLTTAIVVNWNGAGDLDVALPSLTAQDYPALEVLVVDNGSTDRSAEVAARHGVAWVPLGRNLGLAGALNEGARRARGGLLLFLNNDMRFPPDFVSRMVDALLAEPTSFAVDAKQLDWAGVATVHARTRLVRAGALRGDVPGWRFVQDDIEGRSVCLFASAANLLARRERFEALGGWDAAFPVGWEDVDLCWRGWGAGMPTFYTSEARCWHRVTATAATPAGASARARGSMYGGLRFAIKHLPWTSVAVVLLRTLGGAGADLARLRWGRLRLRMSVLARVVAEAPRLLAFRRTAYGRGGPARRALLARLAALGASETVGLATGTPEQFHRGKREA